MQAMGKSAIEVDTSQPFQGMLHLACGASPLAFNPAHFLAF